jgi:hypothetical protein
MYYPTITKPVNKKNIRININIDNVKKKINNLQNEIYLKQKELLEFQDFFYIYDEKDPDIIKINKEINILEDKLNKSLIKYKQFK